MATNVNAAALDESPIPEPVQKQQKQTIDPYNVSHTSNTQHG
jgi:tryptophanyl-tRNA synthetase